MTAQRLGFLFLFLGIGGCGDIPYVANACPLSNEYQALRFCIHAWGCDKTAKDVERYYELEDLDTECRVRAYDERRGP